jgi:hypothetical protein
VATAVAKMPDFIAAKWIIVKRLIIEVLVPCKGKILM